MAHAVKDLFPEAKIAIGPSIEDGFYYDFDVEKPFSPEDVEKIEKRMSEIIGEKRPFERKILKRDEAIKQFESQGETYKVARPLLRPDLIALINRPHPTHSTGTDPHGRGMAALVLTGRIRPKSPSLANNSRLERQRFRSISRRRAY